MGKNVGLDRLKSFRHTNSINKKHHRPSEANNPHKSLKSTYSYDVDAIDCSSASKGLFLGLLCLVIVIVIVIIFLVVKEDPDFPMEILFWMTSGTLSGILVISLIASVIGLYQIRKLSHTGYVPTQVDKLFSSVTLTGEFSFINNCSDSVQKFCLCRMYDSNLIKLAPLYCAPFRLIKLLIL